MRRRTIDSYLYLENQSPIEFSTKQIPESVYADILYWVKESKDRSVDAQKKAISAIWGKDAPTITDLHRIFIAHNKRFGCETVLIPVTKNPKDPILKAISILHGLKQEQRQTYLTYMGHVDLSFYKEQGIPAVHIAERYVAPEHQKQGIGVELECQIQHFAREHHIPTLYNTAQTYIDRRGARVWARLGWDFRDKVQAEAMRGNLVSYAKRNNITPARDIDSLAVPYDFEMLTGVGPNGNVVQLGYDFLARQNIAWNGKRDVDPESPGNSIFLNYLKEKGYDDLIKVYFPPLPKTP